ncbi:MAG: Serine/threonine-protein kinase PknD [Phycisphaerae bacterium]|nr:Serine/threonine-protein kinase PknD [Phycisphaerae bacterium]
MTNRAGSCLSDVEMEALLSGDAPEPLRAHVSSCDECSARLTALRANARLLDELQTVSRRWRQSAHSAHDGSADPALAIPGYERAREIHRGGQGVVYEAVQSSTHRKVAIKVLLAGALATSRQRMRFEREVDLVARLRHPHIVTVHDSGETADGRHFLVMEFIDGCPLDLRAAELRALSTDEATRVRRIVMLFEKVCNALKFAHQNGVIHRDLKPGNVLVDAGEEPHVVDFGLAKAVSEPTQTAGALTQTGDFVGTLAYASPEQVGGDPEMIDIRTDVYALGVMLYEALSGRRPYAVHGPVAEVVRNILEAVPPPPGGGPDGLRVDHELATIVLTALAKDRARRYESVAALGRDLLNYLGGAPIDAKRDSTWYVLRKALRRYRALATAGAAVLLLTVGYAVTVSFLYQRALRAEASAAASRDAESLARRSAEQEARKALDTQELLQEMLASANPMQTQRADVTVRELLDLASQRVAHELNEHPQVLASIRHTIGNAYRSLGLYDQAEPHLRAALKLRRAELGSWHVRTAESVNSLAMLLLLRGRTDQAAPLFEEALQICRRLPDPDAELLVARGLHNLADLERTRGDFPRAEALFTEALAAYRRIPGDQRRELATVLNNWADLLNALGRLDAAAEALDEALAIRRELFGEDSLEFAHGLASLSMVLKAQRRFDEAERMMKRVIGLYSAVLDPAHPHLVAVQNNLGILYYARQQYAEAAPLMRQAYEAARAQFGAADPSVANYGNNLAACLAALGQFDEAARLYEAGLETIRAALGPAHPLAGTTLNNFAAMLMHTDQPQRAETCFLESIAIRRRLGPGHEGDLALPLYNLGELLRSRGEFLRAAGYLHEALGLQSRAAPLDPRAIATTRAALGICLARAGCRDEAEEPLLRGLDELEALFGGWHSRTLEARRAAAALYEDWTRPEIAATFRSTQDDE